MIAPLYCLASVLTTFAISFACFDRYRWDEWYVTIALLIAFYTAYAIAKDHEPYERRTWRQVLPKAAGKWLFWGLLAAGAARAYELHSFYDSTFPRAGTFFRSLLPVYAAAGLPYHLLSEKLRYSRANFLADPYLRFLSLGRNVAKGRLSLAGARLLRGHYRRFLLTSLLRFHYLAIMIEGIAGLYPKLLAGMQDLRVAPSADGLVAVLTTLAWSIDNNNGAIGYLWESNFTRVRFRAVDLDPLHWICTLVCYPPFNLFAGYFLLSPFRTDYGPLLLDAGWFKPASDALLLFFLFGYALTGSTLSFSGSNLSYKGLQTRGMYALVRHPCTFFKLGIFGTTIFRSAASWNLVSLAGYLTWVAIYLLRTVCEERFLLRLPEYAEYKRKTPYRLVPGLL